MATPVIYTYLVKRVRALPAAGHQTLYFIIHNIARPHRHKFFRPGELPEFDGEEAWFEIDRARDGWRFVRQVEKPSMEVTEGSPLAAGLDKPTVRLLLSCGACAWAKSYPVARIVARLEAKQTGGRYTLASAVAGFVQWPCPACRGMRWRTKLARMEEWGQEDDRRKLAVRQVRS